MTDRAEEAAIIRNDEANNLPTNARVIYTGDYNVETSSEAMYRTIGAAKAPNGKTQGQGIDPLNPIGATGDSGDYFLMSVVVRESATDLRYRDDLQVMTTNVYSGAPGGLALVPATYHVFGNNGTTPYEGSVNSGANTALHDLEPGAAIAGAQLLSDLATATDHLPVVADYTLPLAPPALTAFQTWQLRYFGCTNCPQAQPGADADGTGQDNQLKYVAGLNPTNSASIFLLTLSSVPGQPAWKNLMFSPVATGRIYTSGHHRFCQRRLGTVDHLQRFFNQRDRCYDHGHQRSWPRGVLPADDHTALSARVQFSVTFVTTPLTAPRSVTRARKFQLLPMSIDCV